MLLKMNFLFLCFSVVLFHLTLFDSRGLDNFSNKRSIRGLTYTFFSNECPSVRFKRVSQGTFDS